MVKKINLMLLLLIFLISNLLAEEKLDHKIENITFNEITQNEAILKVKLPKNYGDIFIEKESDQIKVEIKNTQLAKKWQHQMDVSEINSIISTIDGIENKDNTTLLLKLKKIEKTKNFTAVKSIKNNDLLITISMLEQSKDLKQVSIENEKISLNLDQVPVQSALQILADSAKLNLVLSDEIKGNITLKLNDVPWKEVLNIILSTKNLGKREIGASLYIAPSEVITKQEEDLLKVKKASTAIEPLKTEFIHIQYARALILLKLLLSQAQNLLSIRGSISADERTNTLIIEDIKESREKIKNIIKKLDIPTKQVLIQAKIIEISRDAIDELGVNYSGSASFSIGSKFGGSTEAQANSNYLQSSLPPVAGSSTLGISFARLPGSISLSMELLALESEGEAKQVSNPHVIVSDNEEAYITQGKEIPYLQATSSGAAAIEFKEAVLELRVTPQIAPNNSLVMDILVKKDQKTADETAGGVPILDKREIKTRLLMKNNETVVLGGIYEHEVSHRDSKVPLLGDIPLLGWLFKSRSDRVTSRELLIFLTPKILS